MGIPILGATILSPDGSWASHSQSFSIILILTLLETSLTAPSAFIPAENTDRDMHPSSIPRPEIGPSIQPQQCFTPSPQHLSQQQTSSNPGRAWPENALHGGRINQRSSRQLPLRPSSQLRCPWRELWCWRHLKHEGLE